MSFVVADVGNSRIKAARVAPDGRLRDITAELVSERDHAPALEAMLSWAERNGRSRWSIASVNPTLVDELVHRLQSFGHQARVFARASDVPLRHRLETPETTGADRAIAVLAAVERARATGRIEHPGQVISCGTAITVERVLPGGEWDGGAIAPGLRLTARSLSMSTAQLPFVDAAEGPLPGAWGRATATAIAAGVVWGVVGSIRELLVRQAEGLGSLDPWRVWTGGDAHRLAPLVAGPGAAVVPWLVLEGLAGLRPQLDAADARS